MIRSLALPLLLLAAGSALAWTAPDFDAASTTQQARDDARERQQRERLDAARQRLAAAKRQAGRDDSRYRSLRQQLDELEIRRQQRLDSLGGRRAAVRDLNTTARQTASDLIGVLRHSPTRPPAGAEATLTGIATSTRALDLDALASLWETLHLALTDTALQSREVLEVQTAPGELATLPVTRIGTVLAAADDRLVVFDRVARVYRALPPGDRDLRNTLAALSASRTGIVLAPFQAGSRPVGGAAATDALRESGPIGFLIALLGGIGLVVLVIRAAILHRLLQAEKKQSADSAGALLRREVERHGAERSESLAGWLNACVRREVRRARWGHTPLSVIIGVAPLLGLLGTVTGMIVTFHSIRLYGGGDPVLMADGIAQALGTTWLGLLVAIPLLIGQRLLLWRANRHIHRLDTRVLTLVAATRAGT